MITRRNAVLIFNLAIICCFLSACDDKSQSYKSGSQATISAASAGDQEVIVAQENHLIKQEVTASAKVLKMLPEDTEGLPHERFLLIMSNGTTVLVAHDVKYAPRVPLQAGDEIKIHGEYIWNARGGLIHWTHHSDNPRHESGWIEFAGQHYE